MSTWIYLKSEPGLYTVGFFEPGGKWHAESDFNDQGEAAARVHYLNGGSAAPAPALLLACRAAVEAIQAEKKLQARRGESVAVELAFAQKALEHVIEGRSVED